MVRTNHLEERGTVPRLRAHRSTLGTDTIRPRYGGLGRLPASPLYPLLATFLAIIWGLAGMAYCPGTSAMKGAQRQAGRRPGLSVTLPVNLTAGNTATRIGAAIRRLLTVSASGL